MSKEWQYEKQKKAWLLKDGSKKIGKMYARGKRVGVAKVKNGVLHIVAPPNGLALKHQKHQVNLVYPKREAE
jgi:hypothetical protein